MISVNERHYVSEINRLEKELMNTTRLTNGVYELTDDTFDILRKMSIVLSSVIIDSRDILADRADKVSRFRDPAGSPIFSRTREKYEKAVIKIDHALHCDFFSEICRDKSGFLTGNAPIYTINKDTKYNVDFLMNWIRDISLPKLEMQTTLLSAICGVAHRYLWYDKEEEDGLYHVYIDMMDPSEIVHMSAGKTRIAVRVFDSYAGPILELYTSNNKYSFDYKENEVTTTDGTETELSIELDIDKIIPHTFAGCPIIEYSNDEYDMGDCDKVLTLMDSYDRIVSDFSNEIEQFRTAYLKATGARLPETLAERQELVDGMEETGIIAVEGSADISWLVKQLDFQGILLWLENTEDRIYRFSSSVNYNNKNFGGQITGVALRHRMQQMKNKCLVTMQEFQASNREMFRLICNFWKEWNLAAINYRDITVTYNLSFPVDLESEANVAVKLANIVSRKTLYKIVNFGVIDNPDEEIKRLKIEQGITPPDIEETIDDDDDELKLAIEEAERLKVTLDEIE